MWKTKHNGSWDLHQHQQWLTACVNHVSKPWCRHPTSDTSGTQHFPPPHDTVVVPASSRTPILPVVEEPADWDHPRRRLDKSLLCISLFFSFFLSFQWSLFSFHAIHPLFLTIFNHRPPTLLILTKRAQQQQQQQHPPSPKKNHTPLLYNPSLDPTKLNPLSMSSSPNNNTCPTKKVAGWGSWETGEGIMQFRLSVWISIKFMPHFPQAVCPARYTPRADPAGAPGTLADKRQPIKNHSCPTHRRALHMRRKRRRPQTGKGRGKKELGSWGW